ncbi:MAG: aminotransferase class III-fold pyridoxal phosphate-dependent enzyme [Chloroflexi bacterium]|nr:MAG: aminotransferase class III-fold pyridoxal phosphate-dependent enzyme [Chloroflexota bacterium]
MRTQLPSVEEQFRATTTRSRELYEQALQVMPGGVTRTSIYSEPYPIYAARGEGCRVWDVDGTRRLDLVVNYTALVAGHAHPAVVEAIREQAARGTSFAAPNPPEVALARELVERIASIEKIRFTNSGTEATMMALRLARAHTGRTKFAKVEGGYHGSHDLVQDPEVAGTLPDVGEFAVVIPYNDAAGATAILDRHGAELAAVIVEPILGSGGMIPADPEYLRALRAACDRHGSLLIFDEVISFRVARGGAQELYGIRPDLTTLGKVIGGGLPVAAFGGRADVMELLDPRRPGFLPQAGTLNGHPLGMAAGVATLALLTPEVYAELDRRGERTREGLRALFAEHEIPAQVTGVSSLMQIHFTPEPVRSSRDVQRTDARRRKEFVLGLCNHGVLLNSRGMAALSTPVGEAEIDEFLEAVDTVLTEARARA